MDRKTLAERVSETHAAFTASAEAIQNATDDTTAEDLAALTSTFDAAEAEYNSANDALELFDRTEVARAIAAPATPEPAAEVKVEKEPLTYERTSPHSIFRDMHKSGQGDRAASERLSRHMAEIRVEQPEKYDLSSTDSAGGYLVAPIWLQNEFAEYKRAGRVTANVIGSRPLPAGTDSINIPTQTGGTSVATQADNDPVSETDATFSTVAADVKTIAGMQDVSQQLLDRSVPGIDEIVFADLARAYNVSLDTAVLNSSVSNNKGLLQVSSINSSTYTSATPTVAGLYPKVADVIQQINSGLYSSADAIIMHPRRWGFLLAGLDTANRPLITPYAPSNAVAQQDGVVAEGPVGSLQGLPVYVDSNVPTTLGSSTTEDRIIVISKSSLLLWEDQTGPYLGTFPDVGSGTLTVRFRLHNYYAQCYSRYAEAIGAVSGTGLVTPTF